MSADSWSNCPRCYAQRAADYKQAKEDLDNAYGNASRIEFLEAKDAFDQLPLPPAFDDDEDHYTLREDHGFLVNEGGTFVASYKAHCSECGLNFEFRHDEQVDIWPK